MTMSGRSGRLADDSTRNDATFQPVAVSVIVAAYLPWQAMVPKDEEVPTGSTVSAWLTDRRCPSSC